MIELLNQWAALAPLLTVGTTLFLAVGCAGLFLTRSPVHRQRLGELTLLAVFAWLVLAFVPLPRLLPGRFTWHASPPKKLKFEPTESAVAEQAVAATELPQLYADVPHHDPIDRQDNSQTNLRPSQILLEEPLAPHDDVASATPPPSEVRLPATEPLPQVSFIFVTAFLSGTIGSGLWLILGHILLARLRRTACPPQPWLAELFKQVKSKSNAAARARLLVSPHDSRPLAWGIVRPTILLPDSLCRPDNQDQLRIVLLHELGHVAQRDALGNLLLCMALPLLYWHPCYWWLRGQMQLAAELVADDWAARQAGKEAYVSQLISLAKTSRSARLPLHAATGIFSTPSQFYRRMNMLLARNNSLATRPSIRWRLASLGLFAAAVALASLAFGVRSAPGQAKVEEKPKPVVSEAEPATESPKEFDAEKAKLIDRIRQLQNQLDQLEGRVGTAVPATPLRATEKSAPGTVTVYRVDEKGNIWSEVWHADEKGKPIKLLKTTPAPNKQIAGTIAIVSRDAQVVVVKAKDQDGTSLLQALDANTGKVMETLRMSPTDKASTAIEFLGRFGVLKHTEEAGSGPLRAVPGVPGTVDIAVAPPANTTTPANPAVPATTSPAYPTTTVRAPIESTVASGSAKQLDLVNLATSYADAVGAVETAKAENGAIEQAAKANAISQREVALARVTLANAQRKEQLLRRIVESALAGSEREFEYATTLHKRGGATQTSLAEAQSRMDILKQILGSSK